VRLEYERFARRVSPAHVHFHAESTEIGWLYGSAGKPVPRMEELHFPLGGERFRPCIEDFLLFIDTEKLYTDWADPQRWRHVLDTSRKEWEIRQAQATVRRFRDAASAELSRLGYTVTLGSDAEPLTRDQDLTSYERRLALGALWGYRQQIGPALTAGGDDEVHEIEVIDALDSAAMKLGGDPAKNMYGAPEY
jgi:hypothetical protein